MYEIELRLPLPSHESKTAINTEDELLKWWNVRVKFNCYLGVSLSKKYYCISAHSLVAETAEYHTCQGGFWCKQEETSWNMPRLYERCYEVRSFNNRNFILKCMEKYAQRKVLFRDTKWLLINMIYRGRDDLAVWACAIARTTWSLHCQHVPWRSKEVLLVFFCGQRVWNLLKSTE